MQPVCIATWIYVNLPETIRKYFWENNVLHWKGDSIFRLLLAFATPAAPEHEYDFNTRAHKWREQYTGPASVGHHGRVKVPARIPNGNARAGSYPISVLLSITAGWPATRQAGTDESECQVLTRLTPNLRVRNS